MGLVSDPNAFLISLSSRMKYNPIDVDSALYMMENDGPNFGLGILHVSEGEFLNEEGKSNCQAQNDAYRISIDE